ncbi:MAG TPA: molybdopterin-dependent oxidoreductase [Solirubrobacteraceae bacterium]|nr:molybdopterin-dependent oxidoreductase [Solirubrobacteraceae bacterium]
MIGTSVTEAAWVRTACILCECNCGIEIELEDRRLARIRGDKAHPGTRGYTCNKAMRLDHYQNGPHRLTTPLRRRADGSFEEIDWDTAIREVAERCVAIRDNHGGESILYYGGGGQGNHLGGSYSGAFLRAMGSRYRSGALAQEKTGEAWVEHRLYGAHTRGEFHLAEVSVFIGKNPWMSQSFPRARIVLKEIAKDPARSMIVIDPVLTDTARLADFHLRVRPGTDAWCLAALVGVLVQEDLVDHQWLAAHTSGAEVVLAAFAQVDIARYAGYCGVDEALIRGAARRIAAAESVSAFEDLGIQQAPHSTLCSYVNRMLWILTGNFGNPGGMHLHTSFVNLFRDSRMRRTPVTGANIIGGLVPCNVIPDEILTDHPNRFRAMIVESANPAHSLADSRRFAEAFEALDLVVVIDVAMTETARHADYVLPAASQYEKPEATYFNFEFPDNTFQLRHALMEPLPGTLVEAEIWARLVRALGLVDQRQLEPLRTAAGAGLPAYARAFAKATTDDPALSQLAPFVLYETLGPTLPEGLASAAALWGLAHRCAMTYPDAVRRAGHADGNALFEAILNSRSGVVFTSDEYGDDFDRIVHADRRITLELHEMLDELRAIDAGPTVHTNDRLPIVLSVGERRSFTANDIFRDPAWRKQDTDGRLRVSLEDAAHLGLVDGARAIITTSRGTAEAVVDVSDAMQAGHASLPNGFGLESTGLQGETIVTGVAPNSLTASDWRDKFAATPWHKHVPARIEPAEKPRGCVGPSS